MGRSKREVFDWLRDRVWSKVENYGSKLLSRAGKEVLIKSVIQAIPTYVMGCFKLPNYLLDEIESLIARFWWGNGMDRKIHWVRWDKLCDSKKQGGMGFRDLKSFNLAMLGKQVWRIIQFPDSLLSRIFKAKYFPRCDVLEAPFRSNASFTWKSIWGSLELVRTGVRWRVGNGRSIDIWRDNWLPRDSCLKIVTPDFSSIGDTDVRFLMRPGGGCWDEDIIRSLLWEDDANCVLQLPLPIMDVPDVRVWHYSDLGVYTVRSGYHLARMIQLRAKQQNSGCSSVVPVQDFNWIWQLQVPNKVKVFAWRLVQNILPTSDNLQRRHLLTESVCPVCRSGVESLMHLFVHCPFSRCLWALSSLPLYSDRFAVSEFSLWFSAMRSSLSQSEKEYVVTACWCIWFNRNKLLHESTGFAPAESVAFVRSYISRFQASKVQFQCPVPVDLAVRWNPPTGIMVKVNFDVSIKKKEAGASLGVVIRDSAGVVLAWSRKFVQFILDPEIGEALALRFAVKVAQQMQLRFVVFEGDCSRLISQVNVAKDQLASSAGGFTASGAIIQEVLALSSYFQSVSFCFVRRSGNELAHRLAYDLSIDSSGSDILPVRNPDVNIHI